MTERVIVKLVCSIICVVLLAVPGLSHAAARELRVSKSVIVHAPPAKVWQRVSNFNDFNRWHPGIAKVEIVAGAGNVIGTERRITLTSGGTVTQKLVSFDARHHRFRVTMLDGAFPVSACTSLVSIKAAGKNRSKVTWSGKFKRQDTGPKPATGANDAAATAAMGAFYQAGLENLKKIVAAPSPR